MAAFLSVIVPVYNVAEYLSACADSVLREAGADVELVLVDDGGVDASGELCDEIAARDTRAKVIHKPNGGLADARNAGLERACGEYVAFLDGDDFYFSGGLLERAISILRSSRPDMLLFNYARVREDGSQSAPQITFPRELAADSFAFPAERAFPALVGAGAYLSSACFRAVRRAPLETPSPLRFEKGALSEDIEFSASLMKRVSSVAVFDETLYGYRVRASSITKTVSDAHVDDLARIIRRLADDGGVPDGVKDAYRGYACFQFCTLLINSRLAGERAARELKARRAELSAAEYSSARRALAERQKAVAREVKELSPLLRYAADPRAKLIKACASLLGLKAAGALLTLYFKLFRD